MSLVVKGCVGASQGSGLARRAPEAKAEGFSSASKLSIANGTLAETIQKVLRER
jgi:hypothetical protein